MIGFSDFLSQGYWWLSLLGGLHCLGLGLYIRYIYHERNGNHKILGSIFGLIALYFFTGMLNRDNSPAPIQLVFTLIIPAYFLMMPLLYLYCHRSLHNITRPMGLSAHFYPVIIVAFIVLAATSYNMISSDTPHAIEIERIPQIENLNLLGAALPGLLSIQTLIYFYLIIQMLRHYRGRAYRLHQETLKDIKFRWLLVLTFAMMSNWLVRAALVILPFYLGDQITEINQAFTRLVLLLTVYILAIYGLKQITRAAYLRGKLTRDNPSATMRSSQQLLSSEELNYLQQLMREDENHNSSKNNSA